MLAWVSVRSATTVVKALKYVQAAVGRAEARRRARRRSLRASQSGDLSGGMTQNNNT
jgi:hypothetical protein